MQTEFVKGRAGRIFLNKKYLDEIRSAGLDDFNVIRDFNDGQSLTKKNLDKSRQRIKFRLTTGGTVVYLKKYTDTPYIKQIKNWIEHKAVKATAQFDIRWCKTLGDAGINTADVVAWGCEKNFLFDRMSFVIVKEIENADSLEKKLPYFPSTKYKKEFIGRLADFAKKFHDTGLRHRDFYLCHIFYSESTGTFTLIDLQRIFKPVLFSKRFQIKDIAQLYYSAPKEHFSKTDRLRFYLRYKNIIRLSSADKKFIKAVNDRAKKMCRHDTKHGKSAGYAV